MKRSKTIAFGVVAVLLVVLVAGKLLRAKNETMKDAYSGVVSVNGFVAETEPYTRYIEETGTLSGDKESLVAAETGGLVMQIMVDVGDLVRVGEPLVRLDDEVLSIEADRAKIAYDKAKMDLDRITKLHDQQSVSESDLENAQLAVKGAEVQFRLANKTYHDATIRAPFSGTIAAKLTEIGQMIDRGQPVVQLVDIHKLKLVVPVSENDIQDVVMGAAATVIVDAAGDTVQGRVTAVGSRAVMGSRTFPVEIEIANTSDLRSGMFARGIIEATTSNEALLVPRAAVLPDAGRNVIYLAKGLAAEKVSVRLLGNSGDRVAVTGVSRGDTILTVGNQALAQGSQINLTLDKGKQQ